MEPVPIMVNGLPGKMAATMFNFALKDSRVAVVPFSLTGADIPFSEYETETMTVKLLHPDRRDHEIGDILKQHPGLMMVDYTHPSAVNDNARFYVRHAIPFVMGTTGGDRSLLEETVKESKISAVIAPNMAKQIVGFQAMMDFAASSFPDLFKGYRLQVKESHQCGKADTSGTAKAVVGSFSRMGVSCSEKGIEMERDPDRQRDIWGIPEAFLSGHGWHTYTLTSGDQTVMFEFKHNVNGRDVYTLGTLDAILYLRNKIQSGAKGQVFTMMDVLKGQ